MSLDYEAEVNYETAAFVAELRRLADALESGTAFSITVDGEEVSAPEGALLSVVHESEDGHVELEFQLSWVTADAEADEADDETADDAEDETEADEAADAEGDETTADDAAEQEPTADNTAEKAESTPA